MEIIVQLTEDELEKISEYLLPLSGESQRPSIKKIILEYSGYHTFIIKGSIRLQIISDL